MRTRLSIAFWASLIILLIVTGESRAQSPSGQGRLTSSGDVVSFVWSPRGDFLLLARTGDTLRISDTRSQSLTDLYQLDLKTRAETRLERNANVPALDPTGQRVAFYTFRGDGAVTATAFDLASRSARSLGAADATRAPAWSGDGARVFFPRRGRTIEIDQASGIVRREFTANVSESPDGTRAVYGASDGLHLVEVTGSDRLVFPLAGGDSASTNVSWAPDSSRVAFIVGRVGNVSELWVISRDGTNAQRLANGEMEFFGEMDWSPRGDALIFTRTPSGSNTNGNSEIWRVQFGASSFVLSRLTVNNAEEAQPRYSPDGNSIAFLRDGDLFVELVSTLSQAASTPPAPTSEIPPTSPLRKAPLATTAQLTPPSTIRVYHTPANAAYPNCRPAIPIGEIDVITFETYVKWVTPSESPASWDIDALKAQAVAARTYGWYKIIRRAAYPYDVTDWTDNQVMCQNNYPSTDAATDATRGQYLAYNGQVIFAEYSADNSDPTTTAIGSSYLLAVDDPVRFARILYGHGHGMSQWGAHDWATYYDWNYQQILLHYYSNTTLEAPFSGSPDTTPPIGSVILPWNNWGVNSNRVLLVANASDNSSNVTGLDFIATYSNSTSTTIAHLTNPPWQYVWDLTGTPDQNPILVSVSITDASGNSFTGNPTRFALDRILPTGVMTAPASTAVSSVPLNLNASDSGSSGLYSMAFSNNWVWEGETQRVQTLGGQPTGTPVSDTDALNGSAMQGWVGGNPAGYWYGPYTTDPPFGQTYRAYFRLKTDNVLTTTEVAMLDVVVNQGQNTLGIKRLRGTDFRAVNQYQEFYVDFYHNVVCLTDCLEFRVAYRATADLWLDRILVVKYPEAYAPTKQWTLIPVPGPRLVIGKFIDGAGNISTDASALVTIDLRKFIPALFRQH